jgi:hypothetical protein
VNAEVLSRFTKEAFKELPKAHMSIPKCIRISRLVKSIAWVSCRGIHDQNEVYLEHGMGGDSVLLTLRPFYWSLRRTLGYGSGAVV